MPAALVNSFIFYSRVSEARFIGGPNLMCLHLKISQSRGSPAPMRQNIIISPWPVSVYPYLARDVNFVRQ